MKQEIMFKKVWDEEEMKLNEKVMPYIREDRIPWNLIKEELRDDEDIRAGFRAYTYQCMVIYFTQDAEEIPTTVRQVARKEMRDEALSFVRHLGLIFGLDWKYVANVLIENKED